MSTQHGSPTKAFSTAELPDLAPARPDRKQNASFNANDGKKPPSSKSLMRELEALEEKLEKKKKADERKQDDKNFLPPLAETDPELVKDILGIEEAQALMMEKNKGFRHWREAVFFREFCLYVVFLALFIGVSLSARPSGYGFWMKDKILDQLTDEEFLPADAPNVKKTFFDIGNLDEFWQWLQGPLPGNLFPTTNQRGDLLSDDDSHYLVYQMRRIGSVRLRQLRVRKGVKCSVPPKFRELITECGAPFKSSTADTAPFGPPEDPTKYTYSTRKELNGIPTWGIVEFSYGGGGYVVDLPDTADGFQTATEQLKQDLWIDPKYTRAVFLEFTLFNPGVNLFCVSQMLVEFPVSGGLYPYPIFRIVRMFRYQYVRDYVRFAFELILMIFVLYYIGQEASEFHALGFKYFSSIWNWYDIINMILFLVVFAMRIYQVVQESRLPINNLDALYGSEFINFQDVAYFALQEVNVNAVNAFLCWFKIFKYVKMSKRLSQLSRTLARAAVDIVNFLLMFMIVFFGYAHMGYMLFGTDVFGFRNYGVCLITLFRAIVGDFDFDSANAANRLVGPIFYISYMVLVLMVLLNMFLAIINSAYSIITTEDETRTTLLNFAGFFSEASALIASKVPFLSRQRAAKLAENLAKSGEIDKDRDGKLDQSELSAALGAEKNEARELINVFDKDRDGKLNKEEMDSLRSELKSRGMALGPDGVDGGNLALGNGSTVTFASDGSSLMVPPTNPTARTGAALHTKVDFIEIQMAQMMSHLQTMARTMSNVSLQVDRLATQQQNNSNSTNNNNRDDNSNPNPSNNHGGGHGHGARTGNAPSDEDDDFGSEKRRATKQPAGQSLASGVYNKQTRFLTEDDEASIETIDPVPSANNAPSASNNNNNNAGGQTTGNVHHAHTRPGNASNSSSLSAIPPLNPRPTLGPVPPRL